MNGHSKLIIVSGSVGVGKTTFCGHVIDLIVDSTQPAWSVKGILAPAVFEGERKTAIEALDLATGERRRLAQRRTQTASGIKTKEWSLDRSTIDWCNQVLHSAVPCDLFVVDELGPLEFERSEGFQQGMMALDSGRYSAALVVVRSELLHFAAARWPHAKVHTILDRDHAFASATKLLGEIQA